MASQLLLRRREDCNSFGNIAIGGNCRLLGSTDHAQVKLCRIGNYSNPIVCPYLGLMVVDILKECQHTRKVSGSEVDSLGFQVVVETPRTLE